MKKTLLAVTILASASVFSMYAQKKSTKQNNRIELRSEVDSLSYAYGVGTAKQGLSQYLEQLGVITNAEQVDADYQNKIKAASTASQKAKLQKELSFKLDSIQTANSVNVASFIEGVNARLGDTEHNASYNTGMDLASQIEKMSNEFAKQVFGNESSNMNLQAIVAGIANVIQNQPLLITDSEELVQTKMTEAQSKSKENKEKEYAIAIEAGNKFMDENSKRPGVITLPSGLQYTIEKQGTGAIPTISDQVKVDYTGRLTNGTVFDSSVDRGEPLTFGVSQVIPGWTEALQLMPVGSKWTIYVPYDLAYGESETGPIKPYSNLVFEIELLDIEK